MLNINHKQIIESVNPSWPKDLIVRYLYVKLAPTFKRDLSFFQASEKIQDYILKEHPTFNRDKVICLTLCEYYQNLFSSFGIKSKLVITNNRLVPHYGLIISGNNYNYFIDPLKDLTLNQLGCATKYYGIIPLSKTQDNEKEFSDLTIIPPETLKEIDQQLGLLDCNMYMDDFLNQLEEEILINPNLNEILRLICETPTSCGLDASLPKTAINDTLITAKIELLNRYLINLGNISGPMERKLFYDILLKKFFTPQEQEQLKIRFSFKDEIILSQYHTCGLNQYVETKNQEGIFHLERR